MQVERKIRLTYPYSGAEGQYSWWAGDFPGIKSGAQLYSQVFSSPQNDTYINDHPYSGGISWLYKDSELSVEATNVNNRGVNYSTKRSGFCVYFIDPTFEPGIVGASGNSLRDLLGDGNPSSADHCGGPYCVYR